MTASLDADVEPVTDRIHETSWSANLERDVYQTDRDLLVAHAVQAVDATVTGTHVNLVTHRVHGHPETYLYDELATRYGDDVTVTYVDQCGCGGHVSRVAVLES